MPRDHDKDVYPEPPTRTPVVESKSVLPNPAVILSNIFYYSVDVPVTAFRDFVDGIQSGRKSPYYHQKFRRVPELTQCKEGDFLCYYEAEMQWRRDFKVDQEIVRVIQDRLRACNQREGASYKQNCRDEISQFHSVSKSFQSRYGDLGAYGSARKCLMKQKERMMAEEQQA